MISTALSAAPTIALYTEGTYPQAHGGVSVWVDQLVRGLPDHRFEVRAISGVPFLRPALEIPANVSFTQVPLWGALPAAGQRPGPARRQAAASAYETLLSGLCKLDLDTFSAGLQAFSVLGREGGFTALLDTPDLSRLTLQTWKAQAEQQRGERGAGQARLPTPTVADALDVQIWLEHALRPLGQAAPQAEVPSR